METRMPARHFTRKPLRIAALQWTGENADEMSRFLGEDFSFTTDAQPGGGAAVRVSSTQRWTPLPIDAWAVLGPGSAVSVMEDHELRLDYQAVA